jgi:hypothetical protein
MSVCMECGLEVEVVKDDDKKPTDPKRRYYHCHRCDLTVSLRERSESAPVLNTYSSQPS